MARQILSALAALTAASLSFGSPGLEGQEVAALNTAEQARLDTLAARVATLTLREVDLSSAGFPRDHPDAAAVRRALSVLQKQLESFPDPDAAQRSAELRVREAFEARLATVATERRLRESQLPAGHPDVKRLADQEAALEARLATLRARLEGPEAAAPRE